MFEPRAIAGMLTDCNCSICRYGALWAYYQAADVRIRGGRTAMSAYLWRAENPLHAMDRLHQCGRRTTGD
jgi:hypothetical protein